MEDYRNRNFLWQPEEVQHRIANACVVIGGMGGLGWQIGGALIGLGVRHIEVFDPDPLELVNLNRLWGVNREQVGKTKVQLFKQNALGVDPDLQIATHDEAVPCWAFEHALSRADVVFGGYDRPEPRVDTQILALKSQTLYIDAGVAIQSTENGMKGFGQVFVHNGATGCDGTQGCIVCAGLKLGDLGYRGEAGGPEPSSGVLNGILANMAVSLWLQHLMGNDVVPVTVFNWNQHTLSPIKKTPQREDCAICGATPAWQHMPEVRDAESTIC